MSRPSAFAPLREPTFRWYYASRAVNLLGNALGSLALAFAVLEVDPSPSVLGVVLAARTIPMLVFLLLGGVLADRLGRTLVIQLSNLVAGTTQLATGLLVVGGHAQVWHLVVLGAVGGSAGAIGFPALAGILPALVPREQLQPANVLLGLTRSTVAVAGPVVASALVVGVGAGWAVAVDGVAFVLAAVLLLGARIPPRARADGEGESVFGELRAGWVYFRGTTWLWLVVVGFGVLNALQNGAFDTLGPLLATTTAIGVHGWGLIAAAEAVGLVVMGLVLTRVRLERPLFWGMLGVLGYGLPILVLGLTATTVPVMAAAFAGGLGVELFGLGWNLAMQENVPDDMLSRAYSYDALGSFAAIPVGQLAAGPLASAFGIRPVVTAAGVAYLVVVLLVLASRTVRTLPRAGSVAVPSAPGVAVP